VNLLRRGLQGPASGHRRGAYLSMAAVLLCGLTMPAATMYADEMYTYTGNTLGPDGSDGCGGCTFNTSYTSITGYFTVSAALPDEQPLTDITGQVSAFSFTDGLLTVNQNSVLSTEVFEVATDNTGRIDAWEVDLATPAGVILSCNGDLTGTDACSPGNGWGVGGAADETFGGGIGLIEGDPGAWSATPEPGSVILLGTICLGAIRMAVRRKRLAQAAGGH
jgi:hypothetical protein